MMAEVKCHSISASTAFWCPTKVQATTRQTACSRPNVLDVFSLTFPHLHPLFGSMAHIFIGEWAIVFTYRRTVCVFDFSQTHLASAFNVHDLTEIDIFYFHSWHVMSPQGDISDRR